MCAHRWGVRLPFPGCLFCVPSAPPAAQTRNRPPKRDLCRKQRWVGGVPPHHPLAAPMPQLTHTLLQPRPRLPLKDEGHTPFLAPSRDRTLLTDPCNRSTSPYTAGPASHRVCSGHRPHVVLTRPACVSPAARPVPAFGRCASKGEWLGTALQDSESALKGGAPSLLRCRTTGGSRHHGDEGDGVKQLYNCIKEMWGRLGGSVH